MNMVLLSIACILVLSVGCALYYSYNKQRDAAPPNIKEWFSEGSSSELRIPINLDASVLFLSNGPSLRESSFKANPLTIFSDHFIEIVKDRIPQTYINSYEEIGEKIWKFRSPLCAYFLLRVLREEYSNGPKKVNQTSLGTYMIF